MPWYGWVVIVLAIGMIIGNIMLLKDSAKKPNLSEEQLKRIRKRNAELDAEDAKEKRR